jgi:hypothetical protein
MFNCRQKFLAFFKAKYKITLKRTCENNETFLKEKQSEYIQSIALKTLNKDKRINS